MCSLILRGGEHHSMNRDRGGGGRGGGGGGGGWGRDGQMDLKVHFVSWSQYINMRALISREGSRIVFIYASFHDHHLDWQDELEMERRGGRRDRDKRRSRSRSRYLGSQKKHTKNGGLNFKVFYH